MEQLTVRFDAESHPADAIQRPAYSFADHFSLELRRDGDDYCCVLGSAEPLDDALVEEFRVAVVDHVLRARIRGETEAARNLVLALAFQNAAVDGATAESVGG